MEWLEFFTDPDPWQVFVGILVLIIGPTALLSEAVFKEKFGAIGAAWRWFRGTRKQKIEERQSATERELSDLRREINRVDTKRKEDRGRTDKQIHYLEEKIDRQHRYILWVTDIFRKIEIWAAEKGHKLPPPPFKTYSEWTKTEEEAGGE